MSEPKRGPGVTEAGHRAIIAAFEAGQRRRADEAAEAERIAAELDARGIPATPGDVRAVLQDERRRARDEDRRRRRAAVAAELSHGDPARKPGRWRWDEHRDELRERLRAAEDEARAAIGRKPRPEDVARHFVGQSGERGVTVGQLRKLQRIVER